jgi:hypothetical protein
MDAWSLYKVEIDLQIKLEEDDGENLIFQLS